MIARLGVVGGGQMGQGIAQVAAQAGLDVVLVDVTAELAAAAIGKLGKTLDKLVEKEAFKRPAEVWEIANVMMFLASDLSSYMTGEIVAVSSQRA